jgi:Thiamine monophosphate synthase
LEDVVKSSVRGGADTVILREKDLSTKQLYELAETLLEYCGDRCRLIINSDINVAKSLAGTRLHLSYSSFMDYSGKGLIMLSQGIYIILPVKKGFPADFWNF